MRGSSVAGESIERVYRSRSVASTLFATLPSKGQAVPGINWFAFEQHCGAWLRAHGFEEVTPTVVDRGVDIIAIKRKAGRVETWVIQCKHWDAKVGPSVVRELAGAQTLRKADRAMLMTSSAFTPDAIVTASALGIDLVDGDQMQAREAA